ncbi:recombinase family protein [Planktomarina temperata]|nr:recombinase family protein [Planktomarina temperata]
MSKRNVVSYFRVSTQKQGRSGLGLQAQQKAVDDYLNGGDWHRLADYTEIESGANNSRPKLHEAIQLCKASGAILCVARLDRLARDAEFLLKLNSSSVDFVAVDMPEANRMTVGIMALVAEQERDAISIRVKGAAAAAKARGRQLGAYDKNDKTKFVGRKGTPEDAQRAREALTARSFIRASDKLPMLKRVDPDGSLSLRAIAEALNANGIPTVSGRGLWSANSVRRLKAIVE